MAWSNLSLSPYHACAITAGGELWCWGQGFGGTLGTGQLPSIGAPARVGTETDWVSAEADDDHSCGLRGDGTLWCWGVNSQTA